MILLFFGDSLTLGTNDSRALGWPGRLIEAAGGHGAVDAYNLGVRANSTAMIKRRWATEAAERIPEGAEAGLVFCFGAVDAARELDPDQTILHARALLRAAKAVHPSLMIGPPPLRERAARERIASLNQLFSGVCRELDVDYLDVYRPLTATGAYLEVLSRTDNIHPTAEGYDMIAALVAGWDPAKELLAKASA